MWQPISILPGVWGALAAVIPIVWIFFSMLKLQLASHKAGLSALVIGVIIAVLLWRMPLFFTLQAVLEGIALALWPILLVVFAAVYTYNLSLESGGMENIKSMLSGISPDRRIQALILAFAFGGFLEAAAGFGTAVAIPAGILAALGFEPLFAAVICLVANTIPVAFGAVGIPVITLGKITDLPLDTLSAYAALQLLPFVIVLPLFLVVLTTGSMKGIKGVFWSSILSGAAFGAGQTITAILLGPELSAVLGSILSLAVLIFWAKAFPVKTPWLFPGEKASGTIEDKRLSPLEAIKAWSPYILILTLILCTRMLPFMDILSRYPFELKYQFFTGPDGKEVSFQLITNPGTIILVSAILGGLSQGLGPRKLLVTAGRTLKQMTRTIWTVASIVALARIMGYSGMISSIAATLSSLTGSYFPLISPLIGALGTFITGSDTSANVLFGELQKQTALRINSNPSWIAAANASGATAGKMVSPQSIAIATTATGLTGSEGKILFRTIKYAVIFVALIGLMVYAVNFWL